MPSPEDICAHEGDNPSRWLGAVSTPIFQTSLFSHRDHDSGYNYTRAANPTVEAAEAKIAALEGTERAACFSSGMGAISSTILHFVRSGARVVAHRNIYGPARNLLSSYLSRFGVETVFVDGNDVASFSAAMNEQTTLVYLESPSTFLFGAQDIRGIAAAARARGAATVIDNTWATPLYQKPLALGADVSVHSASKYLGGHSDIVAGAIAGKADLVESIVRAERDHLGACMDPHQAWLLTRGLRTLPLRMERHSENARVVAAFLEGHELVEKLFWPGTASYPDKAIVEAQMTGYSSVMSFVPRFPLERVGTFLSALKVLEVGPSWGGFESLAVAPGVFMDTSAMAELGLPRNLIRIAVGLESASTITEDLDRALRVASSASVGSGAKGMENA